MGVNYKVEIIDNVIIKLNEIDNYCIEKFGNYNFSIKLLKEINSIKKSLEQNLFIGIKKDKRYKVVMKNVSYNLYYFIDETEKTIYIYDLKSFKQSQ